MVGILEGRSDAGGRRDVHRQVVAVTGGALGIGRAVAERFAADGAEVVVIDIDESAGARAVDAVRAAGGTADLIVADLADLDRCEQLIGEVVGRRGRVDVLVNNAAFVGARAPFLQMTRVDLCRVLDTNLAATALLGRDAARDMARRGAGAIVNFSTVQDALPIPTYGPYVASKGGIDALTRVMAVDLAPHGIRVNTVAPGLVQTPSTGGTVAAFDAGTDGAPGFVPPTLLRRFGSGDEVATAVAYLASPAASFITAALLRVDGGRSVSRLPNPFAEQRRPQG